MSLTLPTALKAKLDHLETELPPINDYELAAILGIPLADAVTQGERKAAWAEFAAFNLMPGDPGEESVWGTHFGPMARFPLEDGTERQFPDLKQLDAEIVAYWQDRARASTHPVLRARYADAVWDLHRKITERGCSDGDSQQVFHRYLRSSICRIEPTSDGLSARASGKLEGVTRTLLPEYRKQLRDPARSTSPECRSNMFHRRARRLFPGVLDGIID